MKRSSFPEAVDTFTELFDLPFAKVRDANRLTELKAKASLTNDEQIELAGLVNGLKDYMVTPETFNKFQDAIQSVQQFFYSNVQGFIEGKQVVWDSYIKQFKFVGKWKTGTAYKFQNMVTDSKGNLYICKESHTSDGAKEPSLSALYWQQASSKGDKGDIGLSSTYQGDWLGAKAYALGDVVCFGRVGSAAGITYIALRANTNKSPATSPDDWTMHQKLFVGTVRPTGVAEGLHFIKEV